MHRAVPVLAATAGGLALLANFHSSTGLAVGGAATVQSGAPPAPAAPSTAVKAPGVYTAGTRPAVRSQGPTSTTPVTVTHPATTVPRSTTPPTTASRAVNGPDVFTRFGDVQVRAVLRSGRLVDVQALQLPYDHRRSAELSQEAAPRLRQEALQAQSANIDVVSGASYTSQGYIESLQGALDAAR